jgi:two-component system, chemotaxis family, chemotaxis protein CheY
MKLMIVDDSKIMRQMIMDVCKQFNGLTIVATAGDGEEAISSFKKVRPEIITMDLTMPNLDGVGAIKEIIRLDPTVKILVISALSDQETALESISEGAQGFLYKPFSKEELTEAILGILN